MSIPTMMAVGLFALPGLALAQSQEELEKRRDAKIAAEVFRKAPWIFDYDRARTAAEQSGKPIFAYFTRSYAG